MEDYEIDFEQVCPKCGHECSHYRNCDLIGCEEGYIDENFEDPINSPLNGVAFYKCSECHGSGIIEWCPSCGYDYTGNEKE